MAVTTSLGMPMNEVPVSTTPTQLLPGQMFKELPPATIAAYGRDTSQYDISPWYGKAGEYSSVALGAAYLRVSMHSLRVQQSETQRANKNDVATIVGQGQRQPARQSPRRELTISSTIPLNANTHLMYLRQYSPYISNDSATS